MTKEWVCKKKLRIIFSLFWSMFSLMWENMEILIKLVSFGQSIMLISLHEKLRLDYTTIINYVAD